MKKLLLIEPAGKVQYRINGFRYFERISNRDYFRKPSLALGVLAALTPSDWEIEILQEPVDRIDYDARADLVGITAVTHTVKRGYEISGEFRKRGIKVIMGGIHPTVLYNEALQFCDSVCIGEAEPVWKEVIRDATAGRLKKIYKSESLFNLEGYTSPRRDLMPKARSSVFNPGVFVEASRGCPYNCDFCSVSILHGTKIRYRPIDNLIGDMERAGSSKFFFVDNNIVANPQRAKALFRALIPLKIRWSGQATISISKDPELLRLAVESGCTGLLIGIESVTDVGLSQYSKNPGSFYELERALKTLKDHGIRVLAHMVFGNDFETPATMSESLERLLSLDAASASIGIMIPYPGTKVALNLENEKRILTKDWNYYDIHGLVFQPANFSRQDLIMEVEKLRKRYFSLKAMLSRTLKYRDLEVLGLNIGMKAHNKVHFKLSADESV
jgi:radical SAM superfamily enzyme YgiQ (UPF0313 family)